MRKRIISGAFALALAASLVACSGQTGNVDQPETPTEAPTEAPTEKQTESQTEVQTESQTEVQTESQTEAQTEEQTESQTEAPAIRAFNAKDLFDAESDEKITITEPSYCEGEKVVVYFEEGAVVPKNLVSRVENVMKVEEEFWNLSYDPTPFSVDTGLLTYYFEDTFDGVGYNPDKVNLIILHEEDHSDIVECASYNELVLFDIDFDAELACPDVIYHEFGHTLRQHQSSPLGQVLEEGIGVYTEWKISMEMNTPCWSTIQYIKDASAEEKLDMEKIKADPEGYFCELNVAPRSAGQYHYQYGVRLITFLREEYDEDIVRKLSEAAAEKTFSEQDNDTIVAILKSVTSEDVFDRFAAWVDTGWPKYEEEIKDYLRPYGY